MQQGLLGQELRTGNKPRWTPELRLWNAESHVETAPFCRTWPEATQRQARAERTVSSMEAADV